MLTQDMLAASAPRRAQHDAPKQNRRTSPTLIQRARQGDAECRERLFALCRSYLGFVARAQVESWLKVKVDASDLVQQTMLEAHRDFDRFEGQSEQEWLAWLRKILAHNVADFVAPLSRHGQAPGPPRGAASRDRPTATWPGAPRAGRPGRTPSQEFLRLDNELRVTAALAELSARLPGSHRRPQAPQRALLPPAR